jgi:protein TonB
LRGGLYDSDNGRRRFQGTVGVRIAIGADGRPQNCQVVRSSGNRGLDGTTCYLLQQRLVFTPARGRDGNPVPSVVESTHVWGSGRGR